LSSVFVTFNKMAQTGDTSSRFCLSEMSLSISYFLASLGGPIYQTETKIEPLHVEDVRNQRPSQISTRCLKALNHIPFRPLCRLFKVDVM
jgi:hypothetical protein